MLQKQQPLSQYWSRHIVLPTVVAVIILIVFLFLYSVSTIRSSEKKNLRVALNTLSMILVDPILLGDHLEVAKRISSVGILYDLNIIVSDVDNNQIAIFPQELQRNKSSNNYLNQISDRPYEIKSNNGRVIGYVAGNQKKSSVTFDYLLLLFLLIVGVFCFTIVLIIRGIRPIYRDIVELTLTNKSEQSSPEKETKLRFKETQETYLTLKQQSELLIIKERETVIRGVALQVAHDVRSPLAALDTLTSSSLELPQDKRVIMRSAVNRIRDIANGLSEKNWETLFARKEAMQDSSKQNTIVTCDLPQLLHAPSLVDILISEKRIEYQKRQNIELDAILGSNAYGLFISVQPAEFKRALSNLINNAVESLGETGQIQVSIAPKGEQIEICIADNGKGIPVEVLEKLGKERISYEKKGGTGRGLYHAIGLFNSWGGDLKIESQVGKGTTVKVLLPRAKTPSWFVPELKFVSGSIVVVVDDDLSIHQVWQKRFDQLGLSQNGIEVIHFNLPQDLIKWVEDDDSRRSNCSFLVDFEYTDCDETGVGAIEKAKIGSQSTLVTSWYEERSVVENCERLGVKLIPKGFVGFVPISVEASSTKSTELADENEVVLIDDDDLVHFSWNYRAKEVGIKLHAFTKPEDFFKIAANLNKDSAIYVDSNLGNNVKGEDVSKEIAELGFKNISLATGYSADSFPAMPWIKNIIDKNPPF